VEIFAGLFIMEINKISDRFNLVAKNYDEQRRSFIPCFDDYYGTSVLFLSKIRKDFKSILDLGAGTGLLSKFLYEKFPAAHYTLIDISEQMLAISYKINGCFVSEGEHKWKRQSIRLRSFRKKPRRLPEHSLRW